MADESFDYLSTMKVLLGIDDDSVELVLQLYYDIAVQSVLNYCNISKLPSALNYVTCELACDAYRNMNNQNTVGEITGNVSSITEDGRKVDFNNPSYIRNWINERISIKRELNRFKKLYRTTVVD